jgi:hypothetical protein
MWVEVLEDVRYKTRQMWAGEMRDFPCVSQKGINKGFCCGQDLERPAMMRMTAKQRDILQFARDRKAMMWIRIFTTLEEKTVIRRTRLVLVEKINRYIK